VTQRTGRTNRSRKASTRRKKGTRSPRGILWWFGLALMALALLTLLSLLTRNRGALTARWIALLRHIWGWGVYLAPIALAFAGLWALTRTTSPLSVPWERVIGILVIVLAALTVSSMFVTDPSRAGQLERTGGTVGYWASRQLVMALGWAGEAVILFTMTLIGLVLAFDVSFEEILAGLWTNAHRLALWLRARLASRKRVRIPASRVRTDEEKPVTRPDRAPTKPSPSARPAPKKPDSPKEETAPQLSSSLIANEYPWQLPAIESLLNATEDNRISLRDIREKARVIEDTLNSLGVPVTVVEVNPGPVVTQFGLEPGYIERRTRQGKTKRVKVKVSRIAALANDLALALAASPIRIEAPVPGKGIVGIEVPNPEPATVDLRGVMESEAFQALAKAPLALALGRSVSGAAIVDDLSTLPHLLIAGATGSGKSVCINSLITCLLCRNTPNTLRLLMVDPKRVELSVYNGIPHLLAPVVVEPGRVVGMLNWLTREMDRRYKVFAQAGARNLEAYNRIAAARGERQMPYIVVFIDELADLMMVSADEVERLICRIAQLARATGIHLVIATQRPSVDVVTGLIKANFPARISFAVSSQIDSRVVLDMPGAEKLLGRGDALYMAPDSPKLERIQACYVSEEELHRLIDFWKAQAPATSRPTMPGSDQKPPIAVEQKPLWPDMASKPKPKEDPLLDTAIALVARERRASVSFLQRQLRIGYTRAARLIDTMEERKLIGPAKSPVTPREVYAKPEDLASPDSTPPKRD